MSNILTDKLPTTILVEGKEYPINTDFRAAIEFENVMLDDDIEEENKADALINLFLYDTSFITDDNAKEVVNQILDFYSCKRKVDFKLEEYKKEMEFNIEQKEDTSGTTERVYDFRYDDFLIYSAFLEQYGIDLQDIKYLHWWKFRALFNSLNNCRFTEILGYRSVNLEDIEDKSQREFYAEMKKVYELPSKEKIKEKALDDILAEKLMNGEDVTEFMNNYQK